MNTFKVSNKVIHSDKRSSIENIHNEKINELEKYYKTLDIKKNKLEHLNQIYELSEKNNKFEDISDLSDEINNLKKEIYNIENQTEMVDYLLLAAPFIQNIDSNCYREAESNNDNINSEIQSGNILDYIEKTGTTNKGEEYTNYINMCFYNSLPLDTSNDIELSNCKECSSKMIFDSKNALLTCENCGISQKYNKSENYCDYTNVEITCPHLEYKRINHFKEWLTQLLARESTNIPDSVIDLILLEVKKERITDMSELTSERIKKYLKKLRLNKYYEHIPSIIAKITDKPPIKITQEFEDKLMFLFDKIQIPFKKNCPKSRKNFLSYSYTIHKFCQLLDKPEYLEFFPLLKNREKLFEQEKIWKEICKDLDWQFIPSI